MAATTPYVLRLDENLKKDIKDEGRKRYVPFATMARILIQERIAELKSNPCASNHADAQGKTSSSVSIMDGGDVQ